MHHYFDPRPKRVYVCNEVHSSCPLLAQKHRSVDSPDQLQWVSYRFCLVVHSVHLFTLKVYESVFLTANARCFNCSASRLFDAVFWRSLIKMIYFLIIQIRTVSSQCFGYDAYSFFWHLIINSSIFHLVFFNNINYSIWKEITKTYIYGFNNCQNFIIYHLNHDIFYHLFKTAVKAQIIHLRWKKCNQ